MNYIGYLDREIDPDKTRTGPGQIAFEGERMGLGPLEWIARNTKNGKQA